MIKKIHIERACPYIVAIAAGIVWFQFELGFPLKSDVLSASLTIGAILTGFLATAKTLLITLDTPIMKRIRSTSYGKQLVTYLGEAIWFCFAFSIFAMIGYFVDTQDVWFGCFWAVLALGATSAFIRVTDIMLKVINYDAS